MSRGRAVWAVVLGGLAAAGRAQEAAPAAPPTGQSIPASFRSFVAVDDRFEPKVKPPKKADDRDPRDRTHKMHDLVVERALNPTVAVFARTLPDSPNAPTAQLVKGLHKVAADYKGSNFGAFAAFLLLDKEFPFDDAYVGGDPAKGFVREDYSRQLRDLAGQLGAPLVPFGLAARKSEQTDAWGTKDESDLVVVLYNRMKVVGRWEFPQGTAPTDAQLKEIIDAATKVAAGS